MNLLAYNAIRTPYLNSSSLWTSPLNFSNDDEGYQCVLRNYYDYISSIFISSDSINNVKIQFRHTDKWITINNIDVVDEDICKDINIPLLCMPYGYMRIVPSSQNMTIRLRCSCIFNSQTRRIEYKDKIYNKNFLIRNGIVEDITNRTFVKDCNNYYNERISSEELNELKLFCECRECISEPLSFYERFIRKRTQKTCYLFSMYRSATLINNTRCKRKKHIMYIKKILKHFIVSDLTTVVMNFLFNDTFFEGYH